MESCTAALDIQTSGLSLNLRALAYMTVGKMDLAECNFNATLKADDIYKQEDKDRIHGQLELLHQITAQMSKK